MSLEGRIEVKLDMHSKHRLQFAVRQGASDGLMAVALAGLGYMQSRMGPGSPSAPGEFPGIVTGTLMGGLHVNSVSDTYKRLESSAEYSIYLEYGTRHMAARPFMRPTAKYMARQAPRIIGPIIARHLP